MKKTYWKNIIRTVRSSLSRFVAIFAIVALGSGFLAGVLASPIDMRVSADDYCDKTDMFDLRVVSTQGLTSGDMEALRGVEGVEAVMPAYDTDLVLFSSTGDAYTTRLHSLPEEGAPQLNRPVVLEGRMPEKAGECVVVSSRTFVKGNGWIGETLTPDPAEDYENLPEALTIVGTVRSALYISLEKEHSTVGTGTLDLKLYTVPESFDQDYYTAAYLALQGGKALNSFQGAYQALSDDLAERLEPFGEERAEIRWQEIVDEANEELNDARKEYEDAKAEAEQELADAKKELEDGQREIEENEEKLADAKQELEDGKKELADGRATLERETASARQQITDGWAQVNSYQSQIDSGRAQITVAQGQISAAREQITAGYAQLDAGDAELAAAKAQLDSTQAQLDALDQGKAALFAAAGQMGMPAADGSDQAALELITLLEQMDPDAAAQFGELKAGLLALAAEGSDSASARIQLEQGLAQYQQGVQQAQAARDELDKNKAQLESQAAQLNSLASQLSAQQSTLDAQKAQLNSSEATLNSTVAESKAKLDQAEKDLAEGQKEYDDGIRKLAEAKEELADGWKEYDEGKAEAEQELADARKEIDDAQAEIDDIEPGEWYIYDRQDNVGFASYASNADKIAAIARVFPVFFFLVAALVALTTMTRMVEEERQQIGTLKALGYSSPQIAAKYLLYAGLASLLGCVWGVLAGMWLFPTVIINAYNIMYFLPVILTPFSWTLALISSIAATLCTLAATLSACWSALREVPARLMLPRAPKAGKRILLEHITPLWSRMKFTQKVTARNLMRYKKRFFMTVIGIAGCTALLVTGFGIRDSISDIVGIQYGELSQYQLIVGLMHDTALEDPELLAVLNDGSQVTDWMAALQESGQMAPTGSDPRDDVTIFVPRETERLTEFFRFRHRGDGSPVEYGENAVIITEKLSERQHLKVGDTITVKNQEETPGEFVITGICENYVYHYLYISPSAYEAAYGKKPEMNSLLCALPEDGPDGGIDALTTRLLQCEDVVMTTSTTELSASFNNSIQSINYIVVVLIVSAGALAFVVVYNLTNINITEREKELATIKVLGFYDGEVAGYVYRETAALTLIGTGLGLLLGIALHQFVIRTAEIDMVMFGRAIYAPSYIYATVLTLVFSIMVNLVMYRKLKRISMVESMKAPE